MYRSGEAARYSRAAAARASPTRFGLVRAQAPPIRAREALARDSMRVRHFAVRGRRRRDAVARRRSWPRSTSISRSLVWPRARHQRLPGTTARDVEARATTSPTRPTSTMLPALLKPESRFTIRGVLRQSPFRRCRTAPPTRPRGPSLRRLIGGRVDTGVPSRGIGSGPPYHLSF